MTGRALVLAAHGSHHDAAATALVHAHAAALRGSVPYDEVLTAFHHGTPGFAEVLGTSTATDFTVVPLLTSAGWFAESVLPRALASHPRAGAVTLRLTAPLGTHRGIADLLRRRVMLLLEVYGLSAARTSVLIAGHGTSRHAESRRSALALASSLGASQLVHDVGAAFIDDLPALDGALDAFADRAVIVLPFFMGGGGHSRDDVPRALGLAAEIEATFAPRYAVVDGRPLVLDTPLGALAEVRTLIRDLATHGGEPARRPARSARATGRVTLVGAGPGDPGLITVRGLAALRAADVVVYDRLAAPELLREAPAQARLVDAGKTPGRATLAQEAIDALLVAEARAGHHVVRLKGGDPHVFGRGHEEVAACVAARIRVEVVPGISSALAGPASVGIPVTARGIARSFTVMTGHQLDDAPGSVPASPTEADTLVVLMGRATLPALVQQLLAHGRAAHTPAACIADATCPGQRHVRAPLGQLVEAVEAAELHSPMVIVIGAVAALGTDALFAVAEGAVQGAAAA